MLMAHEPDKWFFDKINRNLMQLHSVEEMIFSGQTKFQKIEIIRSGAFGKCLVLDSKIQSSEFDEFVYHEGLVHPALITHPGPETVFIAGGGEGATLREVLAHRTVRRAVMIDIDEDVISVSRKYLPDYSRGSVDDPRTELRHVDARAYLAGSKERFDAIIIDLTEPVEAGPAYLLYTQEFYRMASQRLAPDGLVSVQAGCASMVELLNFSAVYQTLRSVFPVVLPYQADIPSFGGPWGFCLASNGIAPPSPEEIDRRIAGRGLRLRLYDGLAHQGMFSLSKPLRHHLEGQTRLITDQQPLYIFGQGR
jgi:spermidine synthase